MSFNKVKTNPALGREIHEYLTKLGIQTPLVENKLSRTDKIDIIQTKMTDIMRALGLDLSDDSLADTPLRVAKMYVQEIYWGLDPDAFPKCTTVENKMKYDEMVVERDITIYSDCEHHLRSIVGTASIAYIPNEKVLGLSKIPRICEYFAKRPQIQERLTMQIFHALEYILETDNIAVSINASHLCVSQRGVEDTSANTTTTKLGGVFKNDPASRMEFFNSIK
jgi:GTP cyclohydrolase I